MKKIAICLLFVCFILFLGPTKAFSQIKEIGVLQDAVSAFSKNMAESLPFNASLGLNWSDAYIGKVFPSVPPHFGVGGSFGVTTMKMGSIDKIAKFLGFSAMPGLGSLIFPAYVAEARIGGIIFPFDIGLKYGKLPSVSLPLAEINFEYSMFGIDARYAVMEGNVVLPKISVGLGYYYLDGGIWAKAGNGMTITAGTETLNISAPKIGLLWNTSVFELKAQVSKQILIVTPYAGLGLSYASSDAGYKVKTTITGSPNINAIYDYLKNNGYKGMKINEETGFSSMISVSGMGVRAFGGVSLNLIPFLKLEFTGMFNLLDQNWGGSLGARFQL
ncbi:MAG: hypothetical protein LBH43_02595 [Treponema sp.]|jgi:hypothetical protein|nr:hypothetical protein [Treponema sp.]